MTTPELLMRDRAEILRSAEEARRSTLRQAEVERYLNPPSDTPYPLEYAFHLLGDVRGKTVLDIGCGTGENIIPLARRGARVIGIDISPDLVALANERLRNTNTDAIVKVGSAYETGLPTNSVDAIFCIALIHHLHIPTVRNELDRVLAKDGFLIVGEPIRFSATYDRLRKLLPCREEVSPYEHPLTGSELATFTEIFRIDCIRYFRLPFIPLIEGSIPAWILPPNKLWNVDRWVLKHFCYVSKYATTVTMRLASQRI